MKKLQDLTFAIIGLGLIGGSYAKALKNLKVKNVIGLDRNKVVTLMALDEGYIDEGCLDSLEPLRQADVIIATLYPANLVEFVREHVQYFKQDVLFTDVTGVKSNLLEQVDALLGAGRDFVSGHPMAGREGKGYGQSAAEIFNGANYIVIKREVNQPEHVQWLKDFALTLGCKHVVEITAEEHDKIIAYTSDLPHVLALSLVNSASLTPNTKYFIAGSFRDATRVADINGPLWADLFLYNKVGVIAEIEQYKKELDKWEQLLRADDKQGLLEYMKAAKQKRKDLFNAKNYR